MKRMHDTLQDTLIVATIRIAFALFLIGIFALPSLAAQPVGVVVSIASGAWVERDGTKIDLALKSEIQEKDLLVTDTTGKVQILFIDDTTVALGSDTELEIEEYSFAGTQTAAFSTNMPQGLARFVTGKIVEQNRAGFTVTTPQSTVGIRGTTFTISIDKANSTTTVYGHQVSSNYPISVTNSVTNTTLQIKGAGIAIDANAQGNKSYTAPAGQFSQNSQSTRQSIEVANSEHTTANTVTSYATTANTPIIQVANIIENETQNILSQPTLGSTSSVPVLTADVTTIGSNAREILSAEAGGNFGATTGGGSSGSGSSGSGGVIVFPGGGTIGGGTPITPSSLNATFAGNFNQGGNHVGTYQFNANLGSGSISNGEFKLGGVPGVTLIGSKLWANGGSGSISGSSYTINGYTIYQIGGGTGVTHRPNMSGSIAGDGLSTSGNWRVEDGLVGSSWTIHGGTHSGTKQP